WRCGQFPHGFGGQLRGRLGGDGHDLRITESGRPTGTRARPTVHAARAAGLVRANEVRVPLDLYWVHGLGLPLVRPEELADNPDLRIGATELIVADVQDHQPVWSERRLGRRLAEFAGLPRVQPRPLGHTGHEA